MPLTDTGKLVQWDNGSINSQNEIQLELKSKSVK